MRTNLSASFIVLFSSIFYRSHCICDSYISILFFQVKSRLLSCYAILGTAQASKAGEPRDKRESVFHLRMRESERTDDVSVSLCIHFHDQKIAKEFSLTYCLSRPIKLKFLTVIFFFLFGCTDIFYEAMNGVRICST